MRRPSDAYHRDIYCGRDAAMLSIECVASMRGDPTEIVGRLSWKGGGATETLFRIDAQGVHGEIPSHGRTFVYHAGDMRIEIEIVDFEIGGLKPWQLKRIERIRFGVRVSEGFTP
jgi:hypothetical protein